MYAYFWAFCFQQLGTNMYSAEIRTKGKCPKSKQFRCWTFPVHMGGGGWLINLNLKWHLKSIHSGLVFQLRFKQ